jgi:GT2 family glycosyltransferase
MPQSDVLQGGVLQGGVLQAGTAQAGTAQVNGPPASPYDADVLILALDRAQETVAAIASALSQTGVARHVIVLDQGSRPAALASVAAFVAGRTDVTLASAGGNLGVAAGRNLAASLGHGRVLVALDNDAEFADATTLARAVAVLDAAPDLGAIGFRIVLHAGGADDLSSWGYPAALLARAATTFDTVTFVGAGHAIRRTAWDAARGYDPALFFCWEELDFCLRAVAAGWRVMYRGDLVVRHKVSAERRVTWSGDRWFYFVRNRIYIARKWQASWVALLPRMAAYAAKGLRNGMLWQTLRAVAAAWRMPVAPHRMPGAMRLYLMRNDHAHRGRWLMRLRGEVMAHLPEAARLRDIRATGARLANVPLANIPLANIPLANIPLGHTPLGHTPLGHTALGRSRLWGSRAEAAARPGSRRSAQTAAPGAAGLLPPLPHPLS